MIKIRTTTHRGKAVFEWGSDSGKRRRVIDFPNNPDAVEQQKFELLTELNIGPQFKMKKLSLEEHLQDFIRFVRTQAKPKGVQMKEQRIRRILENAGITSVQQITPGNIETTICELRRIPQNPKHDESNYPLLSDQSRDHYRRNIKQFAKWLFEEDRTEKHLLKKLRIKKVHVKPHERDRFHPEELEKLLKTAANSQKRVEGFDGISRSWLYLLAAQTGFRRGELGCITKDSFDLESDPPTLTVKAGYSKNGQRAVQPFRKEIVPALRQFLAGHEELVFPGLILDKPRKTALMIASDMKEAGIPRNAENGKRDFHALRNTYISNLGESGLSAKEVQTLARHSDVRITLGYMKQGRELSRRAAGACREIIFNCKRITARRIVCLKFRLV